MHGCFTSTTAPPRTHLQRLAERLGGSIVYQAITVELEVAA
jgi:hypothetical protein